MNTSLCFFEYEKKTAARAALTKESAVPSYRKQTDMSVRENPIYTHSIGSIKKRALNRLHNHSRPATHKTRLPPLVHAASFRNVQLGYTTGHDALTGTRLATES
jgi:hypothetical protein